MEQERELSENPYQSPHAVGETQHVRRSYLNMPVVAAIVLTLLLLIFILATRNGIKQVFEDFDTNLPYMTLAALHPATPLVISGLLLFTVLKEFALPSRKWARLVNWLICLFALLLGGIYAAAIYLPILDLIRNLS